MCFSGTRLHASFMARATKAAADGATMTTATLSMPATAATSTPIATATGAVAGTAKLLLRVEGAALLAASVTAFALMGGAWSTFALTFLLPDLSLLGYLAGARVGAVAYNVGHSTIGPVVLAGLGLALAAPAAWLAASIWLAHIGFDRMLGYGLKYATGFRHTHLGLVGHA
jgi:hypothetical protein